MSGINTEHTIHLKVLTPVHVGGAQEKHLQEDIDYLQLKDGSNWRLNWQEIYRQYEPDQIANAIVKHSLENLLSDDIENVALKINEFRGDTGEVKAIIRDGGGRAYIPGTSIKGALRSWLHTAYERELNKKGDYNILGTFDTALFRFIRPADCYMEDDTDFFPTKTFNLRGNGTHWKGGWKHSFNKATDQNFRSHGFVTDYECFAPDKFGSFTLKITNHLPETFIIKLFSSINSAKQSYQLFYKNDPLQAFFYYVNRQVQEHINKEIIFFEKYKQAEYSDEILIAWKDLLNATQNVKEGQCVLRLAAGTGFHSISGDFQFQDHVDTGIWNNDDARKYKLSKKQSENYIGKYQKFKSRKIAFTSDKMYPMGFVLLSTQPIVSKTVQSHTTKDNEQEKIEINIALKPQEPPVLKAQYVDATYLKTGEIVYGEILELGKPFHKVKLLLNNYAFEGIAELSGVKGHHLSVGQIVKCRLQSPGKAGEHKLVSFVL